MMINKVKNVVSKILQPSSLIGHDEPILKPTESKCLSVKRSDVIDEDEYSYRTTTKRFRSEDFTDIPSFDQVETKRIFDPKASPLFATPTTTFGDSTGATLLYATSLVTKSSPIQTDRSLKTEKFVEKNFFSYPYSPRLSYIEFLRERRRKKVEPPVVVVVDSPPIREVQKEKRDFEIQCDIEPIEIVVLNNNVTPFSWPKFARAQEEFSKKNSIWKCSFCTKENPFDVSLCSLCFAPNPNVKKA